MAKARKKTSKSLSNATPKSANITAAVRYVDKAYPLGRVKK